MPWIGIESLRVDVPSLSFVGGRLEFYEAGVLVDRLVGGIWPERKLLFGWMPSAITLVMKACSKFSAARRQSRGRERAEQGSARPGPLSIGAG